MSPKAGGWIAGTALVGVVIAALAWFLAISPQLNTASATRDQVAAQQSQNELTRTKIAGLQAQFAKLADLKAQLAAVRVQIPTSDDLADYQKQLAGIAALHQVTVTSIQVAPPTPVVPLAGAKPASAAGGSGTSTTAPAAAAAGSQATTTAPSVQAAMPGFYSMTTNLEVVGSYANTLAFLQDLQTGTQRLFLVSGVTATSLKKSDASGGRPATADGDLDLVVIGSLYALTDDTAKAPSTPVTTTTPPPALPVPDPAKNPFKPLG